jgi:uncharacterized protein YlxW (UPF0749 family)
MIENLWFLFVVLALFTSSLSMFPVGAPEEAKDKQRIVTMQIQKLVEMRKSQMEFFDSKIIEIQEKQAALDSRWDEISERENTLNAKINELAETSKRVDIEKMEVTQIKELLRIENESIQVSNADLKAQINKYESLIKLVLRTGAASAN